MRELKLRAFYKGDSEIPAMMCNVVSFEQTSDHYDTFILDSSELIKYKRFAVPKFRIQCEESKCVILQYTGLKDINGTEIYEGDVTEEKNFRTRRIVVWHLHGWFIKELNEEYYTPLTDGDYEIVVGNIFENPELIEAEK